MNTTQGIGKRISLPVAVALMLGACGGKPPAPAETATQTLAPAPGPMPLIASINELMVSVVDSPAESIWNTEMNPPTSAAEWFALEDHALQVATSGTLIMLGGTGPADSGWVVQPAWQTSTKQMVDAALKIRKAVKGRDFQAVVAANGELVDACEACHKDFKPTLPTMGVYWRARPERTSEP